MEKLTVNTFYFKKSLAWRKGKITLHRLMMKTETRAATKMFVAIFVQECVIFAQG